MRSDGTVREGPKEPDRFIKIDTKQFRFNVTITFSQSCGMSNAIQSVPG